jgi:hypothetical protein
MTLPAPFVRVQRVSRTAGWALLLACAVYGVFFPASFFEGYLAAFVFWAEIAFGCMAMLFVQNLTGGLWGMVANRFFEAGMMTIPFCGLLFLPIFFGLPHLYSWVHPGTPELRHLVEEKSAYLNVPFYIARNFLYFGVLSGTAFYLRRLGRRRDSGESGITDRLSAVSGPGLVFFVLFMNGAVIDWVMSLRPEWYSSMLVVEFVTEQAVASLAWSIVLLRCMNEAAPLREALSEKVVHDLGKLLLASIAFWAYITFSEYLIIWTGNLPHEISWFLDRSTPGWIAWAVLLVGLHFVVPLFCLIMTSVTKNLDRLGKVAVLVLVAHFVQIVWWIEPGFSEHFHINWTTPVLVIALGGMWLAVYLRHLAAAPVLPLHDPRLLVSPEVSA